MFKSKDLNAWVAGLMFAPIGQALYPRVNEERLKSKDAAAKLVLKFGGLVTAFFAVMLVAIVILREPLVSFLFGNAYTTAADTLIPLSAWVLFGIVNSFLGVQPLIPFGHQGLYSALMIADPVLALVLNVLLGSSFGAIGVASAIAFSRQARARHA